MEGVMIGKLNAGRSRRSESRLGYRNGNRYPDLLMELETEERQWVLRDREGPTGQ